MNLTKKQIKRISSMCDEELIGQAHTISVLLGCYQPTGANWCYKAGWTYDNKLVVTQFGHVVRVI